MARAAVARAEDSLKYAQSRLVRDKALFEQNLLARKDFETTQEQAATAENDLAEAKSKLGVLLAGSRAEDIDATKAEIARLEAQRRYLEEQIKLARVVSPAWRSRREWATRRACRGAGRPNLRGSWHCAALEPMPELRGESAEL